MLPYRLVAVVFLIGIVVSLIGFFNDPTMRGLHAALLVCSVAGLIIALVKARRAPTPPR